MLIVFLDIKGIIITNWVSNRVTINQPDYKRFLETFQAGLEPTGNSYGKMFSSPSGQRSSTHSVPSDADFFLETHHCT